MSAEFGAALREQGVRESVPVIEMREMTTSNAQSLRAWEDRPRRNFDADVTSMRLESREVFLLTRIDGVSSIAELVAVSGLDEEETVSVLRRLLEVGLIEVENVPGRTRPLSEPLNGRRARPAPPGAAVEEPDLPAFFGVAPEDVAFLRSRGPVWNIPGRPLLRGRPRRPSGQRYDRDLLAERVELTIEQKKEVLFLEANLSAIDLFELLEAEPTDDRKALKKAYFGFSRRFHPDNYFRRNVGSFGARIAHIFKHGSDAQEALAADDELRTRYVRALKARDEALRAGLEAERAQREASRMDRLRAQAENRKDELREQLSERTRARRATAANPVNERIARAAEYYANGMAQYESGSFLAAANSIKLAVSFDPNNESYAQAFERVSEKARQVKAEVLWKRGFIEESTARPREALANYLAAVEIYPRPDYCFRVAELLFRQGEDLHRAAELARKATEADTRNVEFFVLLGRIYEAVDLVRKAIGVFERVLELDPKHEEARRSLKALRRR